MRQQSQDRADLENSQLISTATWNQYISQSYKRLYDMLVAAYGNEYYMAPLFQFNVTSDQYYPLPDGTIASVGELTAAAALYKLIGVDLQYSASPTGWVTLKRFEEIERNKYAYPNTAVNYLGYTNLKYRVSGTNIEFIPIPAAAQLVQLKYIPQPTSLQFVPSCSIEVGSRHVFMPDASDITVGMSVYGPGIPIGAKVLSTDLTISPQVATIDIAALATSDVVPIAFWIDSTVINGISGWEEYIIIDSAIKARVKQEEDVTDLRIQKQEMVAAIEGMAEGRDAGQAHHVSDVLSVNGFGYDGGNGCGSGWDTF